MPSTTRKPKGRRAAAAPRVGFVSLGCPKALVDSEQILTQLRAEGYAIAPSYDGADLVVVNTCGFIDAAVAESLDAIGEALAENGKVIVTGCLGAKEGGAFVRDAHPRVLAVTGPHATQEVMSAVHAHLPRPHDPFVDLVPAHGIKLTPTHYAYLKISEGCNHRCTFCIIPSLRGDLVSRPIGEVLAEAENLVKAGVRELLVISQDTSAYGVDVKYRTGFWQGRPLKTKMVELAKALGEMGVWVRLHYVYPYPHVDDVIPLMAEGKLLPYLDVPFQHASPRILKLMKRPANAENTLARIRAWRAICPDITIRSTFIAGFPGETDAEFEELLAFLDEAADAVELRFVEEGQQFLEFGVGLAREAGDESRADRDVGADRAPGADARQRVLGVGRALHKLENPRARMLERDVEVRQQLAFGHQRNHVVDVRVRIDVVQPHPHAHFPERPGELDHLRLHRATLPEAGAVLDVHAVRAGVL